MTQTTAKSVILGHPGTQYSLQTVQALQEAGLLGSYMTTHYYSRDRITQVARLLPPGLRARWTGAASRRSLASLPDGLVSTAPGWEWLRIAAGALSLPTAFRSEILRQRNLRFDRAVSAAVAKARPDAAHVFDTSALETLRTCRALGILGILDQSIGHVAHGKRLLDEEKELHPEFADSIETISPELVARCTEEAQIAGAIFVSSAYARSTLEQIGVLPERIHQIEYGANTALFKPANQGERLKERPFRFLFVGSIGQRKGIKYLLQAFTKLDLPNCELVFAGGIVGSGSGLAAYKDRFLYRGLLPQPQLAPEYQQADVFVFPSLHESGVMAIHEALASGLPVITTPNAGSVVRDEREGFIVPIRNVEALAEKMLRLYQDRDLRLTMRENAICRAAEFTWERYRVRLAERVSALLTGRSLGIFIAFCLPPFS